jgi:hypothetical protein
VAHRRVLKITGVAIESELAGRSATRAAWAGKTRSVERSWRTVATEEGRPTRDLGSVEEFRRDA